MPSRKSINILFLFAVLLCVSFLCACNSTKDDIPPQPVNITTHSPTPSIVLTPEATPAVAVPTASPTPEPTVEPTPTPIPIPYQSEDYPLTPKSLRTREGGRYPEEKRLNNDPSKFFAEVDLVNQVVLVFGKDESGEYTILVREMICSSGIVNGYRSPRGTFKMSDDYKRFAYFVSFGVYGQYWSQIKDRIYFHSVPYSERDDRYLIEEEFWLLGSPASHGCIRLMPDDAQWIYLYLCPGSTVTITDKKEPDAQLIARLLPTALPEPDCYMIAG